MEVNIGWILIIKLLWIKTELRSHVLCLNVAILCIIIVELMYYALAFSVS